MLNIQPDYQRGFVWDKVRSTRLIHTIMGRRIIPALYVHEQPSGTYDVVDGKQRLTSILAFFMGEDMGVGAPTSLAALPDDEDDEQLQVYSGKSIIDFSDNAQRTMRNYTLEVYVIGKETGPDDLINVYCDINIGSINCNAQQIRKCVFNGPYIRLLDKLCKESSQFQKLLGNKKPDDEKEQDRQFALRFFALKRSMLGGYKQFKGLNKLLNQELLTNKHLEGADTEKTMEQDFLEVVSIVSEIFGEEACRKYDPRTGRFDTKMSTPMYDTVMLGIWRALRQNGHKKVTLISSADSIVEGLKALFAEDEWVAAVSLTRPGSLVTRQRLFDEMINSAVKGKQPGSRRGVPAGLREKLYKQQDGRCALCHQKMRNIKTTEVDHILPLARGGQDKEANMQLVHQSCNRTKGARTQEELDQDGVF